MYGLTAPMTSKLTLNIADCLICTCHGGNSALILKQTVVLWFTFAILTAIIQLMRVFSSSTQKHLSSFSSRALKGCPEKNR